MGAVGLATGTIGVIDSASGTGEHGWGNVAQGVLSGATAAAGGAAIINAIPVLGQVGYGVAIAGGAVVGGLVAGSQLFSETDCLYDPVTGKFTCCNTVFNQGERQVPIGGYMFCGSPADGDKPTAVAPLVRQCLQGDMNDKSSWSDTAAGWWDGMFRDDFWAPECAVRYCDGEPTPASGIEAYLVHTPDKENFCYRWDCASGYKRSGNTCVAPQKNNQPVNPYTTPDSPNANPYDQLIQRISAERIRILNMCGYMLTAGPTTTAPLPQQ